MIVFSNNLCSYFTAIYACPKYRIILPQDINIKINENISLTWIIYGKNISNYYDVTVEMDNQTLTQKYTLDIHKCGPIVLADFKVNSTDVKMDWVEVHQFALCVVLKSAEFGTAQTDCTSSTNVKVFNDSLLQGTVLCILAIVLCMF